MCTVKLSFLGPGKWQMRWWHDAPDSADKAEHLEVTERMVTAEDTLDLWMASGRRRGGAFRAPEQ